MDFMLIRDTVTGKELQVIQRSSSALFTVNNGEEVIEVKKRAMGKAIRAWMKERQNEAS